MNREITVDDTATMIAMAREGKSAGAIAEFIGYPCTRNMVLGRLWRRGVHCTGLVPRDGPPKVRAPALPPAQMPEQSIEPMLSADEPITILTARFGECRFMLGDPQESLQVCGHHAVPGTSYCPEHHRVCYQMPTTHRLARARTVLKEPVDSTIS